MLLLVAGAADAGRVSVQLDGVDGPLRDAVLAGLEINQYGQRDVTAAQARRLYEHAESETRSVLEPYGYYNAQVSGELKEEGDNYVAIVHVVPGDAVKVGTLQIGRASCRERV